MKPGRFRKKPVVIEAVQWLDEGADVRDRLEWLQDWGVRWQLLNGLEIWNKPEGQWIRCPHLHWIIKGVKGEFYPCDPEIFEQTYEAAE